MKIYDSSFVVVDVETTGSNLETDRVIEIGASKIFRGRIVETFHTLINPGRRIPIFITWFTGIANRMVKTAPFFPAIAEELKQFIGDAVFVGHDVYFDVEFLRTEYRRTAKESFMNPTLCTIRLARRVFPGFTHYNLQDLAKNLGISVARAHRALDDSLATAKIFLIMMERLSRLGLDDIRDLEKIYQLNPEECAEVLAERRVAFS